MKTDEFAERLKALSEEELKGMLDVGLKEYTEEAIAGARAELERRGKAGGAKPAAPAVPEVATTAPVPGKAARPSRWGAFLIVLGGFFIYATTLFGVLAVVRSNLKLRVETQQIFQVLIYAVIAFVCLRLGSRRKANWQMILGVSLLVLAGLAFVSLSNISAQKSGSLLGKVIVPTVVIMAVLGVISLLAAYIKKSYLK